VILTRLTLAGMRNYASLDFAPAPGLNVLSGANAQGKSNLLEAIGMLGTGKSFRTSRESDVVRAGLPVATIAGDARLRASNVRLACTLALGASGLRKRYTVNGHGVRYATYLGKLRVVIFVPAHLHLVSGPPALRRSLLNAALAQESQGYYAALAAYNRQLTQKSALLRGAIAPDPELLATYNERLVAEGTPLVLARRAFVAALAERAEIAYRAWVGEADGRLQLGYASNVDCSTPTADAVAAAFASRLRAEANAELVRRSCLVGPHRDDLEFRLGGRLLAAFGSQGQQRTAVLALKLAEYETLEARGGEAPLLLLDDVLSELDPARQRAFLEGVASVEQAFITTTSELELPVATHFRVVAARVEALG
jgi:DNA replication and repair protein RecF